MIPVVINTPTGYRFEVSLTPTMTVTELMKLVEEEEGYKKDSFELSYCGNKMDPHQVILSEHALCGGEDIYLTISEGKLGQNRREEATKRLREKRISLQYATFFRIIDCRADHGLLIDLLDAGVTPNNGRHYNPPPLHYTIDKGTLSCFKVLCDYQNTDTNIIRNSLTPLMVLGQRGLLEMMKYLLLIPSVNVAASNTTNGKTALHYALEGGHEECALALIACKAPISVKDNDNVTPLILASKNGLTEIVDMLLRQGVEYNTQSKLGTPLTASIESEHFEITDRLLNLKNIDVNATKCRGVSPLSLACQSGNGSLIKRLMSTPGIDTRCGISRKG
eukprot:TRINITY_DN11569_c0_g1_i1.p1 TRINITY_DN11569_c0_g1~~TRINITY_DN11569_c0_g1_i1.p1  ORF type:complete len:335 (+),score=68.04 TRINITY_DN11569_c0_g1_i1:471-1475(+)